MTTPDYQLVGAEHLVTTDEVEEFKTRLANFRFALQDFFATTEMPAHELERYLWKNDGDREVEKAKRELMAFLHDLTRYY